MKYPKWVPAPIVTRLDEYEKAFNSGATWETAEIEFQLWHRLATRPEMENVWRFLVEKLPANELVTNGGLTGKVNRSIRYFYTSPRLSTSEYREEMLEISRMADVLANKLKKFCDAASVHNPFTLGALLNNEQLDRARKIAEGNERLSEKKVFHFALDHYLPSFDEQLKSLSSLARQESTEQNYKQRLPRKVNDAALFRTHFIRTIGDFFFVHYADNSPSRLAVFCSCALDDPDITSDLVRKLYVLDDESRNALAEHRRLLKEED